MYFSFHVVRPTHLFILHDSSVLSRSLVRLNLEFIQQRLERLFSRPPRHHHGAKTAWWCFYRGGSTGAINLPLPWIRRGCPVLHNNGIIGAVKMQRNHRRTMRAAATERQYPVRQIPRPRRRHNDSGSQSPAAAQQAISLPRGFRNSWREFCAAKPPRQPIIPRRSPARHPSGAGQVPRIISPGPPVLPPSLLVRMTKLRQRAWCFICPLLLFTQFLRRHFCLWSTRINRQALLTLTHRPLPGFAIWNVDQRRQLPRRRIHASSWGNEFRYLGCPGAFWFPLVELSAGTASKRQRDTGKAFENDHISGQAGRHQPLGLRTPDNDVAHGDPRRSLLQRSTNNLLWYGIRMGCLFRKGTHFKHRPDCLKPLNESLLDPQAVLIPARENDVADNRDGSFVARKRRRDPSRHVLAPQAVWRTVFLGDRIKTVTRPTERIGDFCAVRWVSAFESPLIVFAQVAMPTAGAFLSGTPVIFFIVITGDNCTF